MGMSHLLGLYYTVWAEVLRFFMARAQGSCCPVHAMFVVGMLASVNMFGSSSSSDRGIDEYWQ